MANKKLSEKLGMSETVLDGVVKQITKLRDDNALAFHELSRACGEKGYTPFGENAKVFEKAGLYADGQVHPAVSDILASCLRVRPGLFDCQSPKAEPAKAAPRAGVGEDRKVAKKRGRKAKS